MLKRVKRYVKAQILVRSKWRARVARSAAVLNTIGYRLVGASRRLVRFMNHHVTDEVSDRFVYGLPQLHRRIQKVLDDQAAQYGHYFYFYGKPYQSLGILGVFGERATEERFDEYRIRDKIGNEDRLLDIGCNCGFMALYASFRTGCSALGLDINPFMIQIGNLCADYLRLSDKVVFRAGNILEFEPESRFTVVFSFATHWTDDENYRVPLREHLERLSSYLEPNGLLIFESHAADYQDEEFLKEMDNASDLFDCELTMDTDRQTRHLYHLRKR